MIDNKHICNTICARFRFADDLQGVKVILRQQQNILRCSSSSWQNIKQKKFLIS